ncbi:MAG TPA: hypothetical protein VLN42_13250, partial [Casimicrobiaceae bacterium]|nr:hypothetical protein [Casimicrobiaceae bacterium]
MHLPTVQGTLVPRASSFRVAIRHRGRAHRLDIRKIVDQHSHGDNMLKMNRLANLAAALMLAL